jgi:hypothetical protein
LDALAVAKGNKLRVGDVTAAFVGANPGLTAPDVQLLLGGKTWKKSIIATTWI